MNIVNNSLTVVLIGDWSKFYSQPDWIAENVFEKAEIEIGVKYQEGVLGFSYKNSEVIINPSQEKVIFTATNVKMTTIDFLAKCVSNYLNKSTTPVLSAYGMNISFKEENDTILPSIFDAISDASKFVNLSYVIDSSTISRKITKDDKIVNIEYTQEQSYSIIRINEHHDNSENKNIDFDSEKIIDFIQNSKELIKGLGYQVEDNTENE